MIWPLLMIVLLLGLFVLKRMTFVSIESARHLLEGGALVIDVRNPGEFNSGHLSNAISIPLGKLNAVIERHVPNKDQAVLLHCLSGGRSAIARQQLKQMGYSKVFNLGSYRRAERIVSQAKGNAVRDRRNPGTRGPSAKS